MNVTVLLYLCLPLAIPNTVESFSMFPSRYRSTTEVRPSQEIHSLLPDSWPDCTPGACRTQVRVTAVVVLFSIGLGNSSKAITQPRVPLAYGVRTPCWRAPPLTFCPADPRYPGNAVMPISCLPHTCTGVLARSHAAPFWSQDCTPTALGQCGDSL